MSRYLFFCVIVLATVATGIAGIHSLASRIAFVPLLALTILGLWDLFQKRHTILRNYPVLGHMRWVFEGIRPEIRQYLIESERDEDPFSREERSLVYGRAKDAEDRRPFGTRDDVYASGFAWLLHSASPKPHGDGNFRVNIGGADCAKPYDISLYNISAMSFGALGRERHPRAQHRRQARRIRPRHRRGRHQSLSPSARWRSDLGDRQRLFRLPR